MKKLHKPGLSVNQAAWPLVEKLCKNAETYGVGVKKTKHGTTLIDAGIKTRGGFLAGQIITEICLGGYGHAGIFCKQYDDVELPTISIFTDHPAIATLGSQFGGWQINIDKFSAIGSGPARALSLKPKEIYEEIDYKDKADTTTLVLETNVEPPESVITYISSQCNVTSDRLFLILVPTATIAGSTQISGRIVETGIHKLTRLGFDPKLVTHAWGNAPIAPIHPKFSKAMGRTNDAILYAGVACYTLQYDDDEKLKDIVSQASSSASKSYGKPFFEIFKEVDYDFRRIDPDLFAPAVLVANNAATGNTFKAGHINSDVLKKSFKLEQS